MKKLLKKFVLWSLKKMATRRMKKFKGKVIGVTGSVGKTSVKESIFTVLNSQFKVKRSQKSMNSEFGLLLTILDLDSGYSSAVKWGWLLVKGFVRSFPRDVSEVLLLEMGVDAPGDMDFLTSVIKPDVGVMTNVCPVHLDEGQFEDLKGIFEEKSKLFNALKEDGVAVLNIDDSFLDGLAGKLKERKIATYGKSAGADFRASGVSMTTEGLRFTLIAEEKKYEVHAPVLGDYQVYTLLPAIICGKLMGMDMEAILEAAKRYKLPPGRMSIIPGIKDSTILDSSYNSSPESLKAALKVLGEVGQGKRKIAVLGNMNELGERAKDLHESVGVVVPEYADVLVTVGANARLIGESAKEKGFNEKAIFNYKSAPEASEDFKKKIKEGDVILVKGSQNQVRLERFVKEVMAHPEDAKDLLVRQEKVWLAKL